MTRLYMFCFVALTALSACAPPVPPQQRPDSVLAPPSPEALAAVMRQAELKVEAKKQGEEFRDRWSRWNTKAKELHAFLEAINQESTLVANHPGWSDMAQILKSSASIRHLESEASAARKRTVALTQWSQKWKANGGEIYEKSRLLFKRIAVAEFIFPEIEKDYKEINALYAAWMLLESIGLSEKGADSALKLGDALFYEPIRKMRSELFTLLKKSLIILGFTEEEKPQGSMTTSPAKLAYKILQYTGEASWRLKNL